MQALVLDAPGNLDSFRLSEVPMPIPGDGQIRVKVHATGLNPVDYKLALGGHPAWEYPFILGLDVAGTVDAIADGVEGLKQGDRIVYHGNLSKPGGFAEYAIAEAHTVARVPESVSFSDAVAVPCAGYTAYLALITRLRVKPGMTVLIQAGAGGVGGYAIQLAAKRGCQVIATASKVHEEYVRNLGARYVIDYHEESVPERVLELTNNSGVDCIVDPVGSKTADESIRALKFGGGIACVAGLPDTSKIRPFAQAPSIHEITLGGAYFNADVKTQSHMAHIGNIMMEMLRNGKLDPMVSENISLGEIPEALQRLQGRHVMGKIVAVLTA
jgi:NADPH:quinone reductase